MKRTNLALVLGLVLLASAVVGCSGAGNATPTEAGPLPSHQTSADLPSKSSQMICSQGLRGIVQKTLALSDLPPINSSWADHTYTCTYGLAGGPMVISVKELQDVPNALRYFDGLVAHAGTGEPIVGVASLGLPGFQNASGVVLFTKDNMTLEVDASAMSQPIGPYEVMRGDFAYQIATNILACWSGE